MISRASTPRQQLDFNEVFRQHSPYAWRVLVRLGVQSRDASDACQEVFLVVHRRLVEFDPARGSLRSWVSGICARVASDYRRRHPSRREVPNEEPERLAEAGTSSEPLEGSAAWQQLQRVLDAMDAPKREVFVLYELEGLSMAEIAVSLECPLQTAYARLHAARRLVLAAFGQEREP